MFGLGDAYDKSNESSKSDENTKYMVGAKVTDERRNPLFNYIV